MTQASFLPEEKPAPVTWTPTREAGQAQLDAFAPRAGGAYARGRNFDLGPDNRDNVSALSPYVRRRLILEEEVVRAALARHEFHAAEKFIQEVFWRGYFKGWLEHRPAVWSRYKERVVALARDLDNDAALVCRYQEATEGKTGITCFDAWASELVETGYLHNHARMWFASIWIFTLKLPWELGADFFYRHLLDGDPASNTCSWRWVGGLHTQGKTYLARADNIHKYTDGRFDPGGALAADAPPLNEPPLPAAAPPSFASDEIDAGRYGLIITDEDCAPETLALARPPAAILALAAPTPVSVWPLSTRVSDFSSAAVNDAATRAEAHFSVPCVHANSEGSGDRKKDEWSAAIADFTAAHDLDAVVTARCPLGPVRKRLHMAVKKTDTRLIEITRGYDRAVWPHAARGFFGLKKNIPAILSEIGLG
ncbi:MAG: FAD-binding domain-containing protein [Pseudomonadota bacterium]